MFESSFKYVKAMAFHDPMETRYYYCELIEDFCGFPKGTKVHNITVTLNEITLYVGSKCENKTHRFRINHTIGEKLC
jgi:uncharacterized protein (DUF2461 family)